MERSLRILRGAFRAALLLLACHPGGCTGAGDPVLGSVPALHVETASLPSGGAGIPYHATIRFGSRGGAAPPDHFEIREGSLPPGVALRGEPGLARLSGIPRTPGAYDFTVRAVSGRLATGASFVVTIGEGTVGIVTPSAEEGSDDPEVPACPAALLFVNPSDPQSFHSFSFVVAGGTGRNVLRIHLPPELETSVFAGGGLFAMQTGSDRVQIAGYPSPPGPPGSATPPADRFQKAPGEGGPQVGDDGYSDCLDPRYEHGKYPFPGSRYAGAFLADAPRYRILVEAVDTRGTPDPADDRVARKAYAVDVRLPWVLIDTVVLPPGRAGVDYNELVQARGGVHPLRFALEDAETLGLAIDPETGRFLGIPRASGVLDLRVRVTDALGDSATRTFPVEFLPPGAPRLVTTELRPGADGVPYPGDRLLATGGVPLLVPPPAGFEVVYPASGAVRTYRFDASFVRDASYGTGAGTRVPGLPRALLLDGDPGSAANGQVGGACLDRGFHEVEVRTTDAYLGEAGSLDPETHRQSATASVALGVSPDTALYLRGADGKSGLLAAETCMGEPRMVPMFLEAGLFRADSGGGARAFDGLPETVDLLPVLLCHGGSDAHVDKSIPSVGGFWPAESYKLDRWWYPVQGHTELAWKHLQQETCWIETPSGRRVFLWGETELASGHASKRYQRHLPSGRRGVLVVDPRTGDFWVPAVLDNEPGDEDGSGFGAEHVLSCAGSDPTNAGYGHLYGGYMTYYHEAQNTAAIRAVHLQGLGAFLEDAERPSDGRVASMGRTATSVAASADGAWAATALAGAAGPRLLLWRTDRKPVPAALLAQGHVARVDGLDADGRVFEGSACIVSLSSLGDDLCADSLCFVRRGLLFLLAGRFDRVFGLSLVDGRLSSVDLNARGTGVAVDARNGQYVPDQDVLRGQKATPDHAAQFSFAGDRPGPGDEGPSKVAFVAGGNYRLFRLPDGSRAQAGNRSKSLLFLDLHADDEGGLDLAASGLKDLTGDDARVHGDLLPPGRPGEELDFLAVSPDGRLVAVVRDVGTGGEYSSPAYGRAPSFATTSTNATSSAYRASDDLLVASTDGTDLDAADGVQTVLFLGTGGHEAGFSGVPAADGVPYASARPHLNAKGRRIRGVRFGDDGRALLFRYSGDDTYWTKYYGGSYQYAVNAHPSQSATYRGLSAEVSLRAHLRDGDGGPVDFADGGSFLRNNLDGLSAQGIAKLGPLRAPFRVTTGESDQQLWASFRSPNGRFHYYVVDQIAGRNYLVGFNVGAEPVGGHDPFVPFTPHAATAGFEQFDVNSWNYESRFAACADGIVVLVGSDASAGPESAADLEAWAFDADRGSSLVPLTAQVTDGTANAINHVRLSADGSVLVGQRARTAASSSASRELLNGETDLFAVTNVHAALAGAAPEAFVVSAAASHGSTVAFLGDPPRAVVFSAALAGGNATWDDRTLRIVPLARGRTPETLDAMQSHYAVLAASRLLADDPESGD